MRDKIGRLIKESGETMNSILSEETLDSIEKAAKTIIDALKNGGKVLVFGNGGSASDSQHMAAELVGRFKKERKALAAVALTTDTSTITALANDYGFDMIFKRQLEALGNKKDVAMCISTSGMSKNIVEAIARAKEMRLKTIALLGKDGGMVKELVDNAIVVKSDSTPRIQEAHILIIHMLCELVEDALAE